MKTLVPTAIFGGFHLTVYFVYKRIQPCKIILVKTFPKNCISNYSNKNLFFSWMKLLPTDSLGNVPEKRNLCQPHLHTFTHTLLIIFLTFDVITVINTYCQLSPSASVRKLDNSFMLLGKNFSPTS